MLDIENFSIEAPVVDERPISPGIRVVETTDTMGIFHIEPLERGYGITLGNPMRRILLSSISGAAVTWIKIEDVLHEYSTVRHIKEEVMDLLHNIGQVRIRSVTGRAGKMRLEVAGEGVVSAGDIATSSDFAIVNPEAHIATLDSAKAVLSVELNVEPGKGYQPGSQADDLPRGVLPLDATFNPVRKVNYTIERTRVGQTTDYERLVLQLWTDGSITPSEALKNASEILVNHFFLFNSLGRDGAVSAEGTRLAQMIPADIYQTPIEKLDLSPRTLNSLIRANLKKVGEVLEKTDDELLKIRNFGVKSRTELNDKLTEFGYSREGDSAEDDPSETDSDQTSAASPLEE